ncbi:hypothetical protein V8V50_10460 [Ligilactobacillus salivarius]
MGEKLKLIGHGEFEQRQFLANVKQFIQELVGDVPTKLKDNQNLVTQIKENSNNNNKVIGTCPLCKKGKLCIEKTKKSQDEVFMVVIGTRKAVSLDFLKLLQVRN